MASTTLFALLAGAAYVRSRPNYSDGEQALANAASLKRGMDMGKVIETLHPVWSRRTTPIGYSMRHPDTRGGGEIFHPLTSDRYLVLTFRGPSPGSRSNDPELRAWRLVRGAAPRDDIKIGRAFTPGPFKFYY